MEFSTNLKLLKIFISVVQNQGFANAQNELNLSTSAISTYMSQLETCVGIKLCQRGRSGFALTEQGHIFYNQAISLFEHLYQFEYNMRNLSNKLSGTFNLGILDAVTNDNSLQLPEIIGEYSQKYPDIHLHLVILSPYELQMAVLNNQLDLAIGAFATKMNGIFYQYLYSEQQWLYCGSKNPLFNVDNPSAAQIYAQKMTGRSYLSANLSAKYGIKHTSATIETMEAQLILILSGNYLGYLPEHYASDLVVDGSLKCLSPNEFGYITDFNLIVRKSRLKDPLIASFRKVLTTHIKQ